MIWMDRIIRNKNGGVLEVGGAGMSVYMVPRVSGDIHVIGVQDMVLFISIGFLKKRNAFVFIINIGLSMTGCCEY